MESAGGKAFWRDFFTNRGLIGVCLVAGIVGSVFAVFTSTRQTAQEQELRRLQTVSNILAGYLQDIFANTDVATRGIEIDIRASRAATPDAFRAYAGTAERHKFLRLVVLGSNIEAITLVDDRGQFVASSRAWPPPAINIADRDYFIASRDNPTITAFESGMLRNRATGQRTMFWARRLASDDRGFLGLILATLNTENFHAYFAENLPHPGASISVYRHDGSLLLTTPESDAAIAEAKTLGPGYVARMRNASAGVFVEPADAARPAHLTALSAMNNPQMVIAATSPRSVALEDWTRFAQFLGLFAGLALLLAGWCWWAIVHEARSKNEANERSRQLALANAELETANDALESFSYSVSHDLRAPLRHISGYSAMLLEQATGKLDDAGIANVRKIETGANRMSKLIDNLLNLSHISRRSMSMQTCDLGELAADVVKSLAHAHPSRQVETVIAGAMTVSGDPELLRIAMENLLGNAWKFTSRTAQAKIEVGCAAHDGGKCYFVRDNGAGFDMNFKAKLFGAFERLHSAQEFEGTGIGLSIVKRIIARHGGNVWAEAAVGKGATFYFTLAEAAPSIGG